MAQTTIAWLAQGKVRVKKPGEQPLTIESQFGNSIRERAVRSQQRHSWKGGGDGEKFLAGAMLWGRAVKDPAAIRVDITSLCRGSAEGQMLYSLETDEFCAVLAIEQLGAEERRLWNKNDKRLSHLAVSSDGAVACSMRHKFGTANIAVRLDDDSAFSEVTEGDSIDTAPRWIPGQTRRLVFQSAGVGRNREGQFAGVGPYAIQQLDLDSGDLKTLVEDSNADLLTPQMSADGTLYYIRRPYSTGLEFRPLVVLKDFVLFPFRLAYAIFHYLQFFSMLYSGKKLTTGGDARARQMDMKEMMVWGSRIALKNSGQRTEEAADLVPKTWRLVREQPGRNPEEIATGVLAYDIAPDGTIIYTNGNAIFAIDSNGQRERLHVEPLIEQVSVIH